jgi:hypothetical protein
VELLGERERLAVVRVGMGGLDAQLRDQPAAIGEPAARGQRIGELRERPAMRRSSSGSYAR